MSVAVESFASAWRPQDQRTRSEWASENITVPNSARASQMDISVTPWIREPLDMSADNRVREQILLWPTGAGKSNFIDAFIPHSMAEDPGDILLAVQGDAEAKKYVEKRLLPAIRSVPLLKAMLDAMGRYAARKFLIQLPHMNIEWGGVNLTHAQATSVRAVVIDEAWMAEHGLLEQFRARLHSRWNRRFIAMGQGGMEKIEIDRHTVDTEWHAAWLRTDQREWCFECPQCREVQRYRLRGLLYVRQQGEDGEIDEAAIVQSARYQCIGASREVPTCDAIFLDNANVRRSLASSGRYVVQHPKHRAYHHGWHVNALGIWHETWGDLALAHAAAHKARKAGDTEPLKLFRQKRMAENYRQEDVVVQTVLTQGEYKLEDYMEGQRWPGEVMRCGFADAQRDHYRVVCRVWLADGSSRRIYRGRINTDEQLRDLQQRLGIEDKWFAVDSGHYTDRIYNLCAKYNWRAFKGDDADSYKFTPPNGKSYWKFYSPMKTVTGSGMKPCKLILFSNLQVKRIVERLRNGPQALGVDGDGAPMTTDVPRWEVESDITDAAQRELFSEIERDTRSKITGRYSRAFVQIGSRANHEWDGEVGCGVFALIAGVLAHSAPAPEEKAPAIVNG